VAIEAPGNGHGKLIALANRIGFQAVVIGLLSGVALRVMWQPVWSATIWSWTCGVLIGLPVVNLVGVLADEVRRRDWTFAGVALAVLGLVAYAIERAWHR